MLPKPVPDNSRERERETEVLTRQAREAAGFPPAWKKEKVSQAESQQWKAADCGRQDCGRTVAGLLLTDNLSGLEEY